MLFISTTLLTFHRERSPSNELARRNMSAILVTLPTFHRDRSASNELAPSNMLRMSVTLLTSHWEMFASNELAPEKSPAIDVTWPVPQPVISPYLPAASSGSFNHARAACCRSAELLNSVGPCLYTGPQLSPGELAPESAELASSTSARNSAIAEDGAGHRGVCRWVSSLGNGKMCAEDTTAVARIPRFQIRRNLRFRQNFYF